MAGSDPAVGGVQLPLPVHLRDESTVENFLAPASVAPLLPLLLAQTESGGEASIFLHGPSGSGKSHLLQACCHRAGSEALYLPLGELAAYSPAEVLEGAEAAPLVVVDDLHCVAGSDDWELALFDLCNRLRALGGRLLCAALTSPRQLEVALEDLRSRLSWGVVYQLPSLDDDRKQAVLRFRAERRGLLLPEESAAYIVNRAPRAMAELLDVLERLDQQSLAAQRALTVPFIKQVMNW